MSLTLQVLQALTGWSAINNLLLILIQAAPMWQ